MTDLKLYLASGIFIAITVLKLVFPARTEELRREIVQLIDMDMDYRGMITEVGSLLTDESIRQVIARIDGEDAPPEGSATPQIYDAPMPTVECITPSPTIGSNQTEVSPNVLAAVDAFLTAQEAYADHATPANVSYDVLLLPFDYAAPVDGTLSSGFGYRVHPIEKEVLFHYGTDYEVVEGTAVAAFADGQVTASGTEDGYGNYVEIMHGDGWKTLYAHCSSVLVSKGQQVSRNEVIAYSGQTGRVTGPHLHFELTHNDLYTNPEFFLS